VALVEQVTGELHDDGNEHSNTRRLANLWADLAPDLAEQDLYGLIAEAKARALAATSIRKPARIGGDVGLKNRMPYFFATLKNLLAEQQPAHPAMPIGAAIDPKRGTLVPSGHSPVPNVTSADDIEPFVQRVQRRRRRRAAGPPKPPGGQRGNQNARRHGYTSRLRPVPADQLLTDAKRAAQRRDRPALKAIARGLQFHGKHSAATKVRKLLAALDRQAEAVAD